MGSSLEVGGSAVLEDMVNSEGQGDDGGEVELRRSATTSGGNVDKNNALLCLTEFCFRDRVSGTRA